MYKDFKADCWKEAYFIDISFLYVLKTKHSFLGNQWKNPKHVTFTRIAVVLFPEITQAITKLRTAFKVIFLYTSEEALFF